MVQEVVVPRSRPSDSRGGGVWRCKEMLTLKYFFTEVRGKALTQKHLLSAAVVIVGKLIDAYS